MSKELIEVAKESSQLYQGQASALVEWAQGLTVETPEQRAFADDKLVAIIKKGKLIEEERDKITKPQFQAFKAARALFEPALKACSEAAAVVKGKMLRFTQEQRKQREALEKKQRAEAEAKRKKEIEGAEAKLKEAKDSDFPEVATIAAEQVAMLEQKPLDIQETGAVWRQPKDASTTVKKTRKARIVDADKVPHEWRICEPNLKAINAYSKGQGESAKIPGVEFYWDEEIVRKGGRR